MSQNNQRPDGFSRPDESGSWQDEPQQNHGDASGAASHARPAQRDESTASQPEPYRSVDVDPSWAPPSASYQQATPRPVAPRVGFTEPWRFVTSMFGHALSIFHIGFNMYALWALGRSLEPFLGRARFLAAYLMSGLGGGALFCLMATADGGRAILPNVDDGVVGASGAIFGLFGVLLIVQRRLGASTRELWVVLAINAALLLFISGIAWQAHLGGFLVGMMCGVIFFEDPKRIQAGKSAQTWPRMALLLFAMVAALVVKYLVI